MKGNSIRPAKYDEMERVGIHTIQKIAGIMAMATTHPTTTVMARPNQTVGRRISINRPFEAQLLEFDLVFSLGKAGHFCAIVAGAAKVGLTIIYVRLDVISID